MKNYLTGIIYISLLGLIFTFFAFMDGLQVVATANPHKPIINKVSTEKTADSFVEEYTYSPARSVNGYN